MLFRTTAVLWALLRLMTATTAEAATSIGTDHGEGSAAEIAAVPHYRDYLYTGGHYVNTSDGFVFRGQMYVERLTPANVPEDQLLPPITFIHGGGQTGTNFLTTPSNQAGWSSYFLARHHPVYLVDQPYRGRSPWTPLSPADTLTTYSTARIQQRFTAPQLFALWPQASLHTQWPGAGVRGDPVFDAYYKSVVPNPYASDLGVTERAFRVAVADLLERIGEKVFVVGHSQGGMMAWQAADVAPERVAGVVALEPMGPPWFEQVFSQEKARAYGLGNAPVAWEPAVRKGGDEEVRAQFELVTRRSGDPAVGNCTLQAEGEGKVVRKLVEIAKVPVLLVTAEASYHAVYDWCTVEFLRQAGVTVDFVKLQDRGVRGNGHLFFMEKNNFESAAVVDEWLQSHLP
ncbi:alpha/beta-hydrolase [Botryosphaeria dothidea]|uniref:Alpha/beta-hydrolase n=1 Tax=Botryosphaeria dothidea TaxID=55169 RepID=A0A8H4IYB4_9PEZI|nr:alpha/beta-hydrolase [Botryosphaeria dothidea]